MTDYQTFLANKKCAEPTDPYYGPSLEEFNADLDMSIGTISNIVIGRTYGHVLDEMDD